MVIDKLGCFEVILVRLSVYYLVKLNYCYLEFLNNNYILV